MTIGARTILVWLTLMAQLLLYGSCSRLSTPDEKSSENFIPEIKFNMLVNDLCAEQGIVKKNQQFIDLLQGKPVSDKVVRQLNLVSRKVFDFRSIQAGDRYTSFIHSTTDSAYALVLERDPIHYTIFHFSDSLWIENCENPVTITEKIAHGIIDNSLYETIEELGINHELTNRFVDIYGWKVDFYRLNRGDEFKILYEELSTNGKSFGIGNISGIYFKYNGKMGWAVPFEQNGKPEFFDEEGNSLRKAFLKYPIEFTRISSRYSRNRFHPVLKINRPHLGTDLSASTGTPIRSVGDGVVIESGYKGGNGNYVKIRHNQTYTTAYLHMSRIQKGMHPGVRVERGEVIGYVGMTGLATGPHLCYRFWKNDKQVDALSVELPSAEPVRKELREKFKTVRDSIVKQIEPMAVAGLPKDITPD